MKYLLLILAAIFSSYFPTAAFSSNAAVNTYKSTPDKQEIIDVTTPTVRKLTIKEKIQWLLMKRFVKITDPKDDELARKGRNRAYTGFGFGLAGILLFPLFGIPAIIISSNALAIDKKNPGILGDERRFAVAGRTLGWLGIVLGIIYIILIAAFLKSFASIFN